MPRVPWRNGWRGNWRSRLLIAGMLWIALVAMAVGVLYWVRTPSPAGADVFVTALTAFGTLVLAAATFLSVRQGQRSVSELEKEREQPIVKDEIIKVIQPAIDGLSRERQPS